MDNQNYTIPKQQLLPYRGVQFDVGEHSYIVPAITLDQAEALSEEIDLAQSPIAPAVRASLSSPEEYHAFKDSLRKRQTAMRHVITVAMKRNYPDITDADINDFIDVGNVAEVFNAAMGLNDNPKVRAPVLTNGNGASPSTSAGATSTGGESKRG